jgi:histidine triad (HIT) family protein
VTYDPNNVFAKILRAEMPCTKIYEDEATFVFMDIMPRTPGHALVIPKAPARNLFDVSPTDLAKLIPVVQRVSIAAKKALEADGVSVMQFNEKAGGQVVFHLHFHVMPRWEGVDLKRPGGPMAPAAELEPVAAKIRAAL